MADSEGSTIVPERHDIESVVTSYAKHHALQSRFTERLAILVDTLLSDQSIKAHALEKRTKDVDSFREKLSRPGKSYENPLEDITDLTGLRIIVYYVQDLARVAKLINDEFEVDADNSYDTAQKLNPHEFGYRSLHFVIRLKRNRNSLPEWTTFKNLRAELQVRTVLQHAWAAISHALQYKHEEDVPRESRRKLFRLSGLLELADEEFDELRTSHDALTKAVAISLESGERELDLNAVSIGEYIKTSSVPKKIERLATSCGFKSLTIPQDKKLVASQNYVSQIATFAMMAGLSTIDELDKALKGAMRWLPGFFKQLIKESDTSWSGSRVFFVVLVLVGICQDEITVELLTSMGWSEAVAQRAVRAAKAIELERRG